MAMAVPLIAAAVPSIIGAISNKGSDEKVQGAQQADLAAMKRAADAYRGQMPGVNAGLQQSTQRTQHMADAGLRGGAMYGQQLYDNRTPTAPQGPTPPQAPMNFGPQPGQVAPGVGPGMARHGGGGPPMGRPSDFINSEASAARAQQGPDAYQHMQGPPPMPPPDPDKLNRLSILASLGAGPTPGNVGPVQGPGGGSFSPSSIMGRR
jgi:hypothetical protein